MRGICIRVVLLAVTAAAVAGCGSELVARDAVTPAAGLGPSEAETAVVGEVSGETKSESATTSAELLSAYGNWSEPEIIPGTKGASSVEIGVDAAGNVVAAWLGRRRVVQVAIRSAESGRWSAPLRMRRASEYSGLSLAVAPSGAFVLAWQGVYRRRAYAVTGSVAAGARPPMAIVNSSEKPEVAISADGVATVAWSSRSAESGIYPSETRVLTRRVIARTGAWEHSFGFATRWQGDVAAVAVNAAGDAALLWDSCWFDHGSENGCAALRVATRAARQATWTGTRFAADAYYFDTAGEGRLLGIDEHRSPTIVWAGADESVHAASPRDGGWAKTTVSGPDVYVHPSFSEGVALDVDEQGRAVAAWRGSPYPCGESQAIEVTVRDGGTAPWKAPRRLAKFEYGDPCEPVSNPDVVLARDTALLAWREYGAPASVVRLLWLSQGDTTPAATVSFDAPGWSAFDTPGSVGKPRLTANEGGLVVAAWSDERGVVATFNRVEP